MKKEKEKELADLELRDLLQLLFGAVAGSRVQFNGPSTKRHLYLFITETDFDSYFKI